MNASQDGPGIHEPGMHVWSFREGDRSVWVEFDLARLTVPEARSFVAQLTGVLDAIDPGRAEDRRLTERRSS